MRFVVVLFFIIIAPLKLFGQSSSTLPFFSGDLHSLCQQVESNLKLNESDPVRGQVVDFDNNIENTFSIKNKSESDISVSFWFLPKQLEMHSGTLIAENNVFYFRYLSNRQIQFNHYLKKNINTVGVLSNDVWQHLGFTLSKKGNLTIYYNGDPVLNDRISPDWWKGEKSNLFLGNDRYGAKPEGSIDRLKIWNRVLSKSDFKEDYRATLLQSNLYHKLQIYLPFKGDFKDHSSKSNILEENIEVNFIKDSVRGLVANFSSEFSALKFKNLKFGNQITIAAWVNPINRKEIMGIAGNQDFSFRYMSKVNSLWFTVPNMFKVISKHPKLKLNKWFHLAITVNYNHQINYYINGVLVDRKKIGDNTGEDSDLVIGNSLWGNAFEGQMSQFAIWSKVLSKEEIKSVYEDKLEVDKLLYKSQKSSGVYMVFPILIVLIVLLLVWFVLRKKKKEKIEIIGKVISKEFPEKNAIFLFDNFKALDKNGKDISQEFTPTLVRLFSLILLFPRFLERNINSTDLSDILWETDTISQQKNNRGTNMHRLRKLLKSFDGILLNYKDRKWVFEISDALFIDSVFYNTAAIHTVLEYPFKNLQLNKILKTKNFDNLILQFNEQNLEKLKLQCLYDVEHKNWWGLRKSARLWLSIDPLSESALKYRITALQKLNEKQLALSHYKSFVKYYKETLNEEFSISFEDCKI
ncbi:LamG domain-containing protein [Polaribacter sp. Q13]|uniref:LamG domain-containing protein n=1 Tax=Polaribacter sp. Q13 TaxID=2806551 RepID=UPI00193B0842|nr:LamG domain-containing protein [Polaribacter sp. Q13]QVY66072.1 LamG domain-containing protein [Polaribacter sp. Q13]